MLLKLLFKRDLTHLVFFSIVLFSSSRSYSIVIELENPTRVLKPGFLFAHEASNDTVLLVASFAPFSRDYIFQVKNQIAANPASNLPKNGLCLLTF